MIIEAYKILLIAIYMYFLKLLLVTKSPPCLMLHENLFTARGLWYICVSCYWWQGKQPDYLMVYGTLNCFFNDRCRTFLGLNQINQLTPPTFTECISEKKIETMSELSGLQLSMFILFYMISSYLIFSSPSRTLKIILIMPRAAKTSVLWLEENAMTGKFQVN